MIRRWILLTLAFVICSAAAQPANASIIRYSFEGTLEFEGNGFTPLPSDQIKTVTGYVDLNTEIITATQYANANVPTDGVVDWSYTVTPLSGPAVNFNATDSLNFSGNHVYRLTSPFAVPPIPFPPSTLNDWRLDITASISDDSRLRLGAGGVGHQGMLFIDSNDVQNTGFGEYTFAGTVPEPTSLASWCLFSLLAVSCRCANARRDLFDKAKATSTSHLRWPRNSDFVPFK